jgi:hypothetical protein
MRTPGRCATSSALSGHAPIRAVTARNRYLKAEEMTG